MVKVFGLIEENWKKWVCGMVWEGGFGGGIDLAFSQPSSVVKKLGELSMKRQYLEV